MNWREDLGRQIKDARIAAGLSQLQLAEKTSVKREHISNIELGKNSAAVKIITEIATALQASFTVDGCTISPESSPANRLRPLSVPHQMRLDFGVELQFQSASLLLKPHSEDGIEMRAVFARGHRKA